MCTILTCVHVSVYELYQSLMGAFASKTYDNYTATQHTFVAEDGHEESRHAVGITEGLAAEDTNVAQKWLREKAFPIELFDKGVSFKCADGQTSMPADKVRIIGDIGDKSDELENLVHAHLAAAGLRSALEVGGDRLKLFIEAILCVDDLPRSLAL